jgi:hypothetical protein
MKRLTLHRIASLHRFIALVAQLCSLHTHVSLFDLLDGLPIIACLDILEPLWG